MEITKKQVLKTILLPGIIPRIRTLFGGGFGRLAYLIAVVYNTVKILPNNHPYLNPNSVGKYSIRQVIAAAGSHIKPNKKNIDQIIIFFSVISALIIMLIQFILLIVAMLIPKANAADMPTELTQFFKTPNPQEDIAYRLLDLVFGIPDFFGSKEQVNTTLHQGLHALFEFYSYGMIIVGSMIIVYFIIAVVAETAQSGTPFGQRFNHVWAPVRVILFFGFLIPISHGLNGGQYITLWSAKLGSDLATTGWTLYNDTIEEANETLVGKKEHNVAKPEHSELAHLPAFMLVAKSCQSAYSAIYNDIEYYPSWNPAGAETGVKGWIVYKEIDTAKYGSELLGDQSFSDLAEKTNNSEISVVFGVKDAKFYSGERGEIKPVCGEMVLAMTDKSEPGSVIIQDEYFDLVKMMWSGEERIQEFADNYVKRRIHIVGNNSSDAPLPDAAYRLKWIKTLEQRMNDAIERAVNAQIEQGDWQMPKRVKDYGWGGAGVWFNQIAQQNGALISSVRMTPTVNKYPSVMERVRKEKQAEDANSDKEEKFDPAYSDGSSTALGSIDVQVATMLAEVYKFWEGNPLLPEKYMTGNFVIDTINLVLGTGGLFEICKNTEIHPLAQLSAVGKSMVDSSIRALALSGFSGILSVAPQFTATTTALSGFFSTIAGVGLLVGAMLFYVVPFMPFLYFFFAVGGWIKSIFEAMIGMPLWALAHLRIDGDGIPGEAAISGYYLIFEIFIRPILIVVGLLAAITIFAAMIKVLNEIFYLAISNLSGIDPKESTACFKSPPADLSGAGPDAVRDKIAAQEAELKDAFRGPVDEFFFTIMYTIIVYLVGMSAFRLIDTIPNQILRWIGADDVPAFNDKGGDAAQGLMTYISLGGSQIGGSIGGSIEGMGSGAKASIQQFLGSKN